MTCGLVVSEEDGPREEVSQAWKQTQGIWAGVLEPRVTRAWSQSVHRLWAGQSLSPEDSWGEGAPGEGQSRVFQSTELSTGAMISPQDSNSVHPGGAHEPQSVEAPQVLLCILY